MSDSIASELLQKWVSAVKNGDPKQVTWSLPWEDGILLGTFSNKERVGHDLIFEYFENLLKSPVEVEVVSEHPHVYVDSDAVNSGHYNFVNKWQNNQREVLICLYDRWMVEWKIISHHSSVMPET